MEKIGTTIAFIFVDGFNTWKFNLEEDGETIIFHERQKVDGKFVNVEISRTTLTEQIKKIESKHKIKSIKISERVDLDNDQFQWRTVKYHDTPKMIKEGLRQVDEIDVEIDKLQKKIKELESKTEHWKEYFANSETLNL